MTKISRIITEHSKAFLVGTLLLCVVCAFLMPQVNVNSDMTKYLADDSPMKIGMDLMEEELDTSDSETIRVMFEGLSEGEEAELLAELSSIDYVESVDYEADSEDYHSGDYTLYVVNTDYEIGSDEEESIEDALEADFADYTMVWTSGDSTESMLPMWLIAVALVLLMIILFVMSNSWVEPFLMIATIGVAIVINMGSNILLGTVSDVTYSISAILQIILSMDYSIILMNRYRQELAVHDGDRKASMRSALANAASSVASSGTTTVIGLLMLVFMSFKIGQDLGLVLAKGVLISMICVFTMLPGLVLLFHNQIMKTTKKVPDLPFRHLSRGVFRFRKTFIPAFVVLFAIAYVLQGNAGVSYTLDETDEIAEVFPESNSIVMLYSNEDEDEIEALAETFEAYAEVDDVSSYPTLLGKQCTVDEMADYLGDMSDSVAIDAETLSLLYYDYYAGDELPEMTASEFMTLLGTLEESEAFSSLGGGVDIDPSALTQFMDAETLTTPMSATEMTELFGSMGAGLDADTVELLYLYYAATTASNPAWTLSPDELFTYLANDLVDDARFDGILTDESREQIEEIKTELDDGIKQLKGDDYSLLAFSTSFAEESEATTAFLDALNAYGEEHLSGDFYLIGSSPMVYEMQNGFDDELLRITLLTAIAIFLVVAVTFRSIVIPAVLVLIVQCGVYLTISTCGLIGYDIYYLALLIVQCILMGATIDYGILFTNYYRESRSVRQLDRAEALAATYEGASHAILTSGLIMILVTGILGVSSMVDPTVAQICLTIAIGTTCVVLLIFFVLPGVLAAADRFVVKRQE